MTKLEHVLSIIFGTMTCVLLGVLVYMVHLHGLQGATAVLACSYLLIAALAYSLIGHVLDFAKG